MAEPEMVSDSSIIQALKRKHTARVLEMLDTPIKIPELRKEIDVPKATCYERVNQLQGIGLIEEVGERIPPGSRRKLPTYQRTFNDVTISFMEGTVEVEEQPPSEHTYRQRRHHSFVRESWD